MKQFVKTLQHEVSARLRFIEKKEGGVLQKTQEGIVYLQESFLRLKTFIAGYNFEDESQEILFFKEYKPDLSCQLIFYRKKYIIELSCPTGGHTEQVAQLEKELYRIRDYFDKTAGFYHYYRSGSKHLDHLYFLRCKPDIEMNLESFYDERDPSFSTASDFRVAKIRANDLLEAYLKEKLRNLESATIQDNCLSLPSVRMSWTASKRDLMELIYGKHFLGAFNHGKAGLKELTRYIELVFNVDLSSTAQRAWYDLTIRENPTACLDKMRKLIRQRMDDENFTEKKKDTNDPDDDLPKR